MEEEFKNNLITFNDINFNDHTIQHTAMTNKECDKINKLYKLPNCQPVEKPINTNNEMILCF